jgi:formylglycine-generating enzyme required for sulfatase activity
MIGDYTDPKYKATVSDFHLDRYEVTVGRFRRYVAAVLNGWTPAPGAGKHSHLSAGGGLNDGTEPGWSTNWNTTENFPKTLDAWGLFSKLGCDSNYPTWTQVEGPNENRPINCVSWYDAMAFCIWDGGFLPSEAEWNYAAAAGAEHRKYPWGTAEPGASTHAAFACQYNGQGTCDGTEDIAPVGSFAMGTGKYGQADLAGNVAEWTLDFYQSPYPKTQCDDCANLFVTETRTARGGNFGNLPFQLHTGYRTTLHPFVRVSSVGIRCARTP